MSIINSGMEFLQYLVKEGYITETTAGRNEFTKLDELIDNVYKTGLLSETQIVKALNSWEKVEVEIDMMAEREILCVTDPVMDLEKLERYNLTPISTDSYDGGVSMNKGGSILIACPFKYHDVVNSEYVRNALKAVFKTSVWKIEFIYGLNVTLETLHFKYIKKFVNADATRSDGLLLRQKIIKVFRDSAKSGTMDTVFLKRGQEVTILRKYMDDFFEYKDVRITGDEVDSLKTMLLATIGGVPAVKVDSEPSIDFKIENLVEDGKYEGRASFMDTKDGYQIHVRLIALERNNITYDDYDLTNYVREGMEQALHNTTGLIMVTGPRGSGKQVFTYATINKYQEFKPNAFIETLEDPVEARLEGNIGQIEINEARGYGFDYYAKGLKRHSTNLYFVGEMRDKATAESVATETSSAGLVLSTTHTPDCAGFFKKMSMDLKGDNDLLMKVISEIRMIVNLTMAKQICPKCRQLVEWRDLTKSEKLFLDSWNYKGPVWKGKPGGCEYCQGENYKKTGKMESQGSIRKPLVVVEGIRFDEEVEELLRSQKEIPDKEYALRKYMVEKNLYKTQNALRLVCSGKLALQECMRLFTPNRI